MRPFNETLRKTYRLQNRLQLFMIPATIFTPPTLTLDGAVGKPPDADSPLRVWKLTRAAPRPG